MMGAGLVPVDCKLKASSTDSFDEGTSLVWSQFTRLLTVRKCPQCIDKLFERLAPHLGETDCTIIGDSAFGCFPMVRLCQKYRWHYLFRDRKSTRLNSSH